MQDYEIASKIITQNPDLSDFVGPREKALVDVAEKALELKFPPTYQRFLLEYGAGSFGSFEVFGIINENFESSSVPDAIWYTLTERKGANLPRELTVIGEDGMGGLFCLNLGMMEDDEAHVTLYIPGHPINTQPNEVIAKDFGEFLLTYVQQQLEE
jgi:hypothetical protein